MATGIIKYDGQLNGLKVLRAGSNGYVAVETSSTVHMPNLTQAVFFIMGGAAGRTGYAFIQTTSTGIVTINTFNLGASITVVSESPNEVTITNKTGSGGGTYVHILCFNGNVTVV